MTKKEHKTGPAPEHMLERNFDEKKYFHSLTSAGHKTAYRRAVEICTGGLPSWAMRRRSTLDETEEIIAEFLAGKELTDIASDREQDYQTVYRRVTRAGVDVKARTRTGGVPSPVRAEKPVPLDDDDILAAGAEEMMRLAKIRVRE